LRAAASQLADDVHVSAMHWLPRHTNPSLHVEPAPASPSRLSARRVYREAADAAEKFF